MRKPGVIMTITQQFKIPYPSRQRGAAALIISIILLLAITLMTFAAAKVAVTEQKISANYYHATQAFEAAQAGLERGFANLADPAIRAALIRDDDNDGVLDMPIPANPNMQGTLSAGRAYTVTYDNPIGYFGPAGRPDLILITSTGTADNGAARRVVTQMARITPPPPAPLIVQGTASVNGLLSRVTNNDTNLTIWSGGEVFSNLGLGSGCLGSLGLCTVTSDGTTGIAKNDARLATMTGNEFFENFFADTKESIRAQSIQLDGARIDTLITPAVHGEYIWIDAGLLNTALNANVGVTIGSPDAPVVLIVDGDLNVSVDVLTTIYGVVYVAGDLDSTNASALFSIQGSLIVEGDLTFVGAASDLTYRDDDGEQRVARVSGSWID